MNSIKSRSLLTASAAAVVIGLGALGAPNTAAAWEPTETLEIIAHTTAEGSTYQFGAAVIEAIEANDLLEEQDIRIRSVQGARGGNARAHVAMDNADNPHVVQVLTPSQINNPILAQSSVDHSVFRGLAALVVDPLVMVVNAESPYETIDDLVEAARENPGEVLQGGGDFGQVDSLTGQMFAESQDIQITFTPFDGEGIAELAGGHVDFVLVNPPQIRDFVADGRLRIIGASESLDFDEDIPTFEEAGYDFQILRQYRGLWAGGDVPDEAVDYWIDLLDQVRNTEEFQNYVTSNSLTPMWVTGGDLDDMLQEEHESYTRLNIELGLMEEDG